MTRIDLIRFTDHFEVRNCKFLQDRPAGLTRHDERWTRNDERRGGPAVHRSIRSLPFAYRRMTPKLPLSAIGRTGAVGEVAARSALPG